MLLDLPDLAVSDRVSVKKKLEAGTRETWAELDGPGCIRHIWVTMTREHVVNRTAVMRIYFDGHQQPFVEAPVGDFFGAMHGRASYPLNTRWLSVQGESGYNCYFPMPFAQSARLEFEAGEQACPVYLMVDWHRYPQDKLTEPWRFCARWRREAPTEAYGEDFVMADADGPGRLMGFVYGVRLIDDTDRWSHGGGLNAYIDGQGAYPAYLRGIGGEDEFGTSYGGALHVPETHLHAGMPYYVHEDVGQARPAQRVVGYRFFNEDTIDFRESLHLRFGSMANDICATTYWYAQQPPGTFFRLPDWSEIAALPRAPGDHSGLLPRGSYDVAPPFSGGWWLCGPFGNADGRAMMETLPAETDAPGEADYEGFHRPDSPWLTDGSVRAGLDRARWVRRDATHGFIDFNHVFRPHARGVAPTDRAVAVARCALHAEAATSALLRIAWDDDLSLRINDGEPIQPGRHEAFREEIVPVVLKAGENTVTLKLSNDTGSNHGGWAFAFAARSEDRTELLPRADGSG
ncbi:MAG: DUF2961 domain-containing protein [Armatimonadota bacterium]